MAGYTLATLKQAIQDYTDNQETTFVNNLDNFIEAAEERILKEAPLEVFRKNATTLLTLGGQYLAKPTDWLFSYSLSIEGADGDKVFLLNKDVNFIQEFWPDDSDTGTPRYYADFDVSNFIMAPTPDAAYTAELHYFYRPASLITTSGSTQTWLSENAGPAMLYGSLVEAYTFMKGDGDMIAQYEGFFQRALSRINAFAQAAEGLDFYRRSKD
jgi:hypothetical protein